jgi:hypothetical protein
MECAPSRRASSTPNAASATCSRASSTASTIEAVIVIAISAIAVHFVRYGIERWRRHSRIVGPTNRLLSSEL